MSKKTLYIIGAGASEEANLLTGSQLKKVIADYLDIRFEYGLDQISGDRKITDALKLSSRQTNLGREDINPYLYAGWRIRDAMPQAISIDNFIDTHSGDKKIELCGKLAIVRSILDAEKNSLLHFDETRRDSSLNFSRLEETWYSSFMKLLTENCKKDELSDRMKSIALIVFNYDRCIEHFLYNAIQNYYGITVEEAGRIVNTIEIYHPYGIVGRLPWQSGQGVKFGAEVSPGQLLELAKQIKTFTEGTDPNSSEILAIRNNILESERIVFLGFAFHRLNLELMSPNNLKKGPLTSTKYFGTAHGISDSDCKLIEAEIVNFKPSKSNSISINNSLKCSDLFKEYWRSLSMI